MVFWSDGNRWHKAGAALGALAVHCLFAALLIWGLAIHHRPERRSAPIEVVTALDLPAPPKPEPEPEPSAAAPAAPAAEGRAAAALPVAAPDTRVALAPDPAAPSVGEGVEISDGAGSHRTGQGAGGAGPGDGAGGIAKPAKRIAGALRDSDYPRSAARAGAEGAVAISFRVRTDGRVDRCSVIRSSGHDVLDELTCRLFTQRYRFLPATTAAGRPVESTLQTSFTWGTRRR